MKFVAKPKNIKRTLDIANEPKHPVSLSTWSKCKYTMFEQILDNNSFLYITVPEWN